VPRTTRRHFIQTVLAAGAQATCWPLVARAGRKHRPVVLLGFDGVDPRLVERFGRAGMLPNLMRLARSGHLGPLASTSPPNSPVAWSTFATGRDPGEHGVFGFLTRDAGNYLPAIAPYSISPPRFSPYRAARAVSRRQGRDFWQTLDGRGRSLTMLFVPYAYPPPRLRHGRVIAGLGACDLRFTNSSFTYYTSESSRAGKKSRAAGGRIVPVQVVSGQVRTSLQGPWGPGGKPLTLPLVLVVDRRSHQVTINLAGQRQRLTPGQRSNWFKVVFTAEGHQFAGRLRFHLIEVTPDLKLYATPIGLDPRRPALPLGWPGKWLSRSVQQHDLSTVGWVHDTSAVNAGVLPAEVFLQQLLDTMQQRASLLLREISTALPQVTLAVFTGTDRAAHMFYRQLDEPRGGAIGRVYRLMDDIVGRVQSRLPAGCQLVVMSDHGFHPFDHQLHLNNWLVQQGMQVRRRAGQAMKFLRGIDWSRTSAYALGNGQIYVNQLGREGKGTVPAGPARQAVLEKAAKTLLELRHPETGRRPVRAVVPVADRAAAGVRDRAPDLQVAFAPGWRSSWETSLGGAPATGIFAPNPKAWCGDHAASHEPETPGFIACGKRLRKPDPWIGDLANSLLALCGIEGEGRGRALL